MKLLQAIAAFLLVTGVYLGIQHQQIGPVTLF